MPITLLTDFGTADYYVAAMRGVLLSRSPHVPVVDITHDVPPQDIHAAAFTLLAAYRVFPDGVIHTVVVDPGVGSARRPIIVTAAGQMFVGPDNGVFSYIYDREPDARVFHVTNDRVFRHPVSTTFHGRDVFAPVAAALSVGVPPADLGIEIGDAVRLEPLRVERTDGGSLRGRIIHVDRFGNCVTNVTPADLPEGNLSHGFRLLAGGREIRTLRRYYADEGARDGDLFAIWGSAGFLEISANRDSAARRLNLRRGDPITIEGA